MNTKPEISTTPVPGTQAAPVATPSDQIQSLILEARASYDSDYVPVATCVDWLLDCFNLADGAVRDVIALHLPNYSHGNLREVKDIEATFEAIELELAAITLD